jgi:hypothetical protein
MIWTRWKKSIGRKIKKGTDIPGGGTSTNCTEELKIRFNTMTVKCLFGV